MAKVSEIPVKKKFLWCPSSQRTGIPEKVPEIEKLPKVLNSCKGSFVENVAKVSDIL